MRVRVRTLPADGGLDLKFQSLPGVMGKAVASSDDDLTEVFARPVECELRLELMGKDIHLTGGVETTIHPICARCGEPFEQELKVDTDLTCRSASPGVGGDSYQESEDGLVYFRDEELDLDEIVREQMLLALPMRYLCRKDCRGLCPTCGVNLNLGPHVCTVRAGKKS